MLQRNNLLLKKQTTQNKAKNIQIGENINKNNCYLEER